MRLSEEDGMRDAGTSGGENAGVLESVHVREPANGYRIRS